MMSSQVNATASLLNAREYLRVSLDRSGRARSVADQHIDNERGCATHGATLGEPYRDDSVSASAYTRKVRDDFARLMADLHADRFGADLLVLWESSRGSRKVGEWVELIDVCAERGVRFLVTTHGRIYDPRNGRDRRSLLEDAVDSEYESYKVSTRVKRDVAIAASEGRPHGRVPFGYRRVYDERTGALVGQEPDQVEAPIVREVFERIVRGHSLRSIARDFAERGIASRDGVPFSAASLRSMAVRDSYAGRRVHMPGRTNGTQRPTDAAQIVTASWEAIVSESDFLAVQRILSDPARRTTRPGRAVHLLSMIARCAECDAPLAAVTRRNGRKTPTRMYQCHVRGCVRVDADELDALAEQTMLAALESPDNSVWAREGGDDEQAREEARGEVARLRTRLDELADAVADGSISVALAARSEPRLRASLRDAESRERALSTPSALRGLIEPGEDVNQRWAAAVMSTKREVARLLLAPDMLGTLGVTRRPEGRRGGRHVVPTDERVVRRFTNSWVAPSAA